MSLGESQEVVYTPEEIYAYLLRISFPENEYKGKEPGSKGDSAGDRLVYLSLLQKFHLTAVPFENLSLHYSKTPYISLDKDDLFEKIVKNWRGGYCMENNRCFGILLRSLGFEVVQTGARVWNGSNIGGWGHHVNLVPISGTTYVVDVGFGGPGPTHPLPVVDALVSKWGATKAESRLTYKDSPHPFVQGLWTYEHRISESHDWRPIYCFGMTEFSQRDFEIMNFATSSRRTSWFTQSIVCTKMLLDDQSNEIVGIMVLTDKTLKKRVREESETLAECTSENERVELVKKYFGIVLSEKQRDGIRGTVAELEEGI